MVLIFQPKSNSSSACPETMAARWKIISGLEETNFSLISFLEISPVIISTSKFTSFGNGALTISKSLNFLISLKKLAL